MTVERLSLDDLELKQTQHKEAEGEYDHERGDTELPFEGGAVRDA